MLAWPRYPSTLRGPRSSPRDAERHVRSLGGTASAQPSTPAADSAKSEGTQVEGNDDALAEDSEAEQEESKSDTATDDPSDIDAEEDPESVLE